jgi:hypothetical protein
MMTHYLLAMELLRIASFLLKCRVFLLRMSHLGCNNSLELVGYSFNYYSIFKSTINNSLSTQDIEAEQAVVLLLKDIEVPNFLLGFSLKLNRLALTVMELTIVDLNQLIIEKN